MSISLGEVGIDPNSSAKSNVSRGKDLIENPPSFLPGSPEHVSEHRRNLDLEPQENLSQQVG